LSEIPWRIIGVPHEWRNDCPAVSYIDSVKLNFPWRCGITDRGRRDPVHLDYFLLLHKAYKSTE